MLAHDLDVDDCPDFRSPPQRMSVIERARQVQGLAGRRVRRARPSEPRAGTVTPLSVRTLTGGDVGIGGDVRPSYVQVGAGARMYGFTTRGGRAFPRSGPLTTWILRSAAAARDRRLSDRGVRPGRRTEEAAGGPVRPRGGDRGRLRGGRLDGYASARTSNRYGRTAVPMPAGPSPSAGGTRGPWKGPQDANEAAPGGRRRCGRLDQVLGALEDAGLPGPVRQTLRREVGQALASESEAVAEALDRAAMVLALPWRTREPERFDPDQAAWAPHDTHGGLERVKTRIIEVLAACPQTRGQLTVEGPRPGAGPLPRARGAGQAQRRALGPRRGRLTPPGASSRACARPG